MLAPLLFFFARNRGRNSLGFGNLHLSQHRVVCRGLETIIYLSSFRRGQFNVRDGVAQGPGDGWMRSAISNFAQKIVYIANHELLLQDQDAAQVASDFVDGITTTVIDPITGNKKTKQAFQSESYEALLQAIGNSIIVQLDALHQEYAHEQARASVDQETATKYSETILGPTGSKADCQPRSNADDYLDAVIVVLARQVARRHEFLADSMDDTDDDSSEKARNSSKIARYWQKSAHVAQLYSNIWELGSRRLLLLLDYIVQVPDYLSPLMDEMLRDILIGRRPGNGLHRIIALLTVTKSLSMQSLHTISDELVYRQRELERISSELNAAQAINVDLDPLKSGDHLKSALSRMMVYEMADLYGGRCRFERMQAINRLMHKVDEDWSKIDKRALACQINALRQELLAMVTKEASRVAHLREAIRHLEPYVAHLHEENRRRASNQARDMIDAIENCRAKVRERTKEDALPQVRPRDALLSELRTSTGSAARHAREFVSENANQIERELPRPTNEKATCNVLDDVIFHLRAELVSALKNRGPDCDEARYLRTAISEVNAHRSEFVFVTPANAYLRTSYPTSLLQPKSAGQGWENMVGDHGLRQIPFADQAGAIWGSTMDLLWPGDTYATDRRRRRQQEGIDKQFWQNVNTVRVAGAGQTNYALVKDDLGNWYVKYYSADAGSITRDMVEMALAGLGETAPVSLLQLGQTASAMGIKGQAKELLLEEIQRTLAHQVALQSSAAQDDRDWAFAKSLEVHSVQKIKDIAGAMELHNAGSAAQQAVKASMEAVGSWAKAPSAEMIAEYVVLRFDRIRSLLSTRLTELADSRDNDGEALREFRQSADSVMNGAIRQFLDRRERSLAQSRGALSVDSSID